MQEDSEKTFGDIYNGHPGPHLQNLFLTLQQPQMQLERTQVQKWAANLRFLCLLSNVIPEPRYYPVPPLPASASSSTVHSVPTQAQAPAPSPLSLAHPRHGDLKSTAKKCSCDRLFDQKPFSSRSPGDKLYVSDRGAAPSCRDYVAVSYCWQYAQRSSSGDKDRQDPVSEGSVQFLLL